MTPVEKSEIFKNYADVLLKVLIMAGAIILFFSIQFPGSESDNRFKEENIRRERAKLLLEILNYNEKEELKQLEGLEILKKSYSFDKDEWIYSFITDKQNQILKVKVKERDKLNITIEELENQYSELELSKTSENTRIQIDRLKVRRDRLDMTINQISL